MATPYGSIEPVALPQLPRLSDAAYQNLASELDRLLAEDPRVMSPSLVHLLQIQATVLAADLYRDGTQAADAIKRAGDDDLMGLCDRLMDLAFRPVLGFVPTWAKARLGAECEYDPGRVAERCLPLIAIYADRILGQVPESDRVMERSALAVVHYSAVRHEQLRRRLDDPLGTLLAVALHGIRGEPEAQEQALNLLSRRYLSRDVLKILKKAYEQQPSIASTVKSNPKHQERRAKPEPLGPVFKREAGADRDLLLAKNLAPLKNLDAATFYRKLLGRDPDINCLPTRVYRDAINLAESLSRQGNTLPAGTPNARFLSLDAPPKSADVDDRRGAVSSDDLDPRAQVPRLAGPGVGIDAKCIVQLVREHLGEQEATIFEIIIEPGDDAMLSDAEIGRLAGCTNKDPGGLVRSVKDRALQHHLIGPALLSLKVR